MLWSVHEGLAVGLVGYFAGIDTGIGYTFNGDVSAPAYQVIGEGQWDNTSLLGVVVSNLDVQWRAVT